MIDQPRVIDFDDGEISVRLDGRELRGWSYKDDAERRIKMLAAREYVEGWCDAGSGSIAESSDGRPCAGGMQTSATEGAITQSPARPMATIAGGPIGPSGDDVLDALQWLYSVCSVEDDSRYAAVTNAATVIEEALEKRTSGAAQGPANPDYGKMSVDMAIEACAKVVEAEFERMLAQQYPASKTGMEFTDTINTNIRMMACHLPNIAASIRALAVSSTERRDPVLHDERFPSASAVTSTHGEGGA